MSMSETVAKKMPPKRQRSSSTPNPTEVAETLSGTYTLVAKSVHGDPVQVTGILRLTPTTFTQEFQEVLEGEAQSLKQFVTGSYKLVRPFDQNSGTIHWYTHGDPRPSVVTYTWDGRFLALVFRADATQYIYNREGPTPDIVEPEDESQNRRRYQNLEPEDGARTWNQSRKSRLTDGIPIDEITDAHVQTQGVGG